MELAAATDPALARSLFAEAAHVKMITELPSNRLDRARADRVHARRAYWGLGDGVLGRDLRAEMDAGARPVGPLVPARERRFGGGAAASTTRTCCTRPRDPRCSPASLGHAAATVASPQRADGSFAGDEWGEVDTLSVLAILGDLAWTDEGARAARARRRARSTPPGRGVPQLRRVRPGAESHAGQVFCCVGALAIAGRLDLVDAPLLGWWLAERQCDSGGLNGRPEKQADVCYSWWVLSALSILGRLSWIDEPALARFILQCQDADDGGVGDRPGNMADVFHTFFGVAGLALLGWFAAADAAAGGGAASRFGHYRPIDAVYALPAGRRRRRAPARARRARRPAAPPASTRSDDPATTPRPRAAARAPAPAPPRAAARARSGRAAPGGYQRRPADERGRVAPGPRAAAAAIGGDAGPRGELAAREAAQHSVANRRRRGGGAGGRRGRGLEGYDAEGDRATTST